MGTTLISTWNSGSILYYQINEQGSQFKEERKKKIIPIKTHSEKLKAYLENIEDYTAVMCNKIGKNTRN
jgi:hypothetical protein